MMNNVGLYKLKKKNIVWFFEGTQTSSLMILLNNLKKTDVRLIGQALITCFLSFKK